MLNKVKYIHLILIFSVGSHLSSAQELDKKIDSLISIYPDYQISYLDKINFANQILEECDQKNDLENQFTVNRILAVCYSKIGIFKTAQKHILHMKRIEKKIPSTIKKVRIELLSASYSWDATQYEVGAVHFRNAYRYYNQIDSLRLKLLILNGMSLAYMNADNDSSLYVINKALKLVSKSPNISDQIRISIILNKANTLFTLGHQDSGYVYLIRAYKESISTGNEEPRAMCELDLGYYYLQKEKIDSALIYFRKSVVRSKKVGVSRTLLDSQFALANTLSELGRFEEALTEINKGYILKDSLSKIQKGLRVDFFEAKQKEFELELKEDEVKILEKQKRIDKFKMYMIGIGLVITVLILIRLRADIKKRKQMHQMQEKLMQHDIEAKKRDLTNLAIDITRKTEFTTLILDKVKEVRELKSPEEREKGLKNLILYIQSQLGIADGLKIFQDNIDQISHEFFDNIGQKFPDLTANERQICGLIRLNLSNKDIAIIKNISPVSAKKSRYRLRKKLGLNEEDDIQKFLSGL